MTILVTGGLGFMGSNFIRVLHHKYPQYKIINLDALTYAGNPENLIDLVEKKQEWYVFAKNNIEDFNAVESLVMKYKPEIIVNFAAESHVDRSLVDSSDFIKTNVSGVDTLLRVVRKFGIRFVQISTDEVYGDVPEGKTDENAFLSPSNPYAASKAAADLLIQSYINCYDIPAIIVRGSNNFGPYQYPEKLIPLVITNLLSGEKIPLHGAGDHIRTWIHVHDFVDGVIEVIHAGDEGEIYNIAGKTKLSNQELIQLIAGHMKIPLEGKVHIVDDRPGADFRYAPDGKKMKIAFGWEPQREIVETIPEVIQWYIKNESWWQSIKKRSAFQDHYEKQKQACYY